MFRYRRLLLPLMALPLLCGCSSPEVLPESSSESTPAVTETATKAANTTSEKTTEAESTEPAAPAYDFGDCMPILSITTADKSSNAIDFITKPVTRHVAESIASWTPGYKMPPEPYYTECAVTLTDTDENVLLSNAGAQVKVRGNWTTTYDKKPLRIKFDEKQSMLGLNDGAEYRNWVLLAEYKDASMLRNKSALSIARELLGSDGLYAADAELVEVVVNGRYWGVYLLTEMQQVNSGRVDVTAPEAGYTGYDIGYFLEFDGYFTNEDELHGFFVDYSDNAALVPFDGNGGAGRTMQCLNSGRKDPKKDVGFTVKSDINSKEQIDFISNFVNGVYDIMYHAAYEDKAYVFNSDYSAIEASSSISPEEAVERVVDLDSLADMYIISELTCDADIYWSSFFLSADFGPDGGHKLRFEAPWDFDSAMGNKDRCSDGTGFYAANIVPDVNGGTKGGGEYDSINPWLAVLMYEDWFTDIIREKWTNAYDSGVFSDAVAMINSDADDLSSAFDRNYERWDNLRDKSAFGNELSRGAMKCRTHKEAAGYLADWLQKRINFLNDYWHK